MTLLGTGIGVETVLCDAKRSCLINHENIFSRVNRTQRQG